MKKFLLCLVLAALCPFFAAQSQSNRQLPAPSVAGKVTDEQGNALPGATVKISGTQLGTTTDSQGSFKLIHVPADGTLIISFIGYTSVEVPYATATP